MKDEIASPVPRGVILIALAGAAFVALPIAGLAARAPWSELGGIVTRGTTTRALAISLIVSVSAAGLCLLAGVPLGLVLARARFPGKAVLRAVVLLPLVAPPVVGGVALLSAFGRRGLVGRGLARLGITLPFSTAGAIVAATFVAMPLVILAVESGLRARGPELEEAASTLGARPGLTLRAVTLPLIRPQILAAFVLAWARALGEFGATITFAGNISGRTQTLPLAVFESLQSDPGAAVMLSVVLMASSLVTLVALRGRVFAS